MPVTFTFHKFSERKPAHNEDIVQLSVVGSFGFYGFEPREGSVEYSWVELDPDGSPTGNSTCYDVGDGDSLEGHRLVVIGVDGYEMDANTLWMSDADYTKVLEENIVR